MKPKTKLFLILWLAGMSGILAFLLIDFSALLASLPLPAGSERLTFTPTMKLLSLLQPAVLLFLAVLLGVKLATKVGLSSPVAEAAATGGRAGAALQPQVFPGIIGGLVGGIALVLLAALVKPFLPADVFARVSSLGALFPLPIRLLYGGIVEELLLRWGFMTLLVWAAWRLFLKGIGRPGPACFIGAILLSSLIFAMGHLPLAFLVMPHPSFAFIAFVICGNSAFGLIAGFLYWKKGLESAMLAHVVTHLVLFTAQHLGAYF